ncbi:hypothetical protein ACJIZ3_018571 [Penstemon smallii]|uniref:Uncharacterized protein n=1 Tax=Penstemon smallii TaxID=265156 RepID=A0ABD3SYP9_9LAMI
MFRHTKEHAETYPYVWGSYLTVYGGFGLWLIYRWRRLRGTEDRVRALQERLRIVFEEQQPSNSAAVTKAKIIKEQQSSNSAQVTEQSSNSASLENKVPPADKATE